MPKRIGFIGLGIMGRAMAANLLKAGFELAVHNRTSEKMQPLVSAGAKAATTPREVAEASEVVITMVSDTPDVRQVLLGHEGVAEGAHPGLIAIDMSTISPGATREMAARLAERGVRVLDAPVSGGERGAIEATLSIMVGGEAEVFGECLPIFEALGKNIVHVGPTGMGQTVKLCNQIVCGLNLLAVAEGLVFAARAGADVEKVLQAISGGAAGSWMLSNLAPRILRRDFAPGFTVKLQQKDLRLALEAARELHLPLPGTGLVHQIFAANQAAGEGDEGTQAIVKALERLGNTLVGVTGGSNSA